MSPDSHELSLRLAAFAQEHDFDLKTPFDTDWRKSGVYAVLDCVFSSMARYESVVVPTLARFGARSGLADTPDLKCSEFLAYLRDGEQRPTPERFEAVAVNIFANRQRIAQRLKVEVAYDVCAFFAEHGLETKADLQAQMQGRKLECLIVNDLQVRGIGLALRSYLLICLGDTSFVKPDTLLLRRVGQIGDWSPRASDMDDFNLVRDAVTRAGEMLGVTPAHLDHLLWKYESQQAGRGAGKREDDKGAGR